MEEEIRRLCQKVGNSENDVLAKYDQIKYLLKENKPENAKTLANDIVSKEEDLMELQSKLSFLINRAKELQMTQLCLDLTKRIDGIGKILANQFNDCKRLKEGLIENRDLERMLEEINRSNGHRMDDNGANDNMVAAVIHRA